MDKQKTVIMLKDVKNEMLRDRNELALVENKKLREVLELVLCENKELRDLLEHKQQEVDSYKKESVERKKQCSSLRKLYEGVKKERNEYYRMYLRFFKGKSVSGDLRKKGNRTKAARAFLGKIDLLQNELDVSNQISDNNKKHIFALDLKNRILYRKNICLKKRLEVYHTLHEGENDAFNTVLGIVNELEEAFRTTFEFTEPSLKGMAKLFKEEKARMENLYAGAKRMDEMFEKIVKAQDRLDREVEGYKIDKKMVEELYPKFSYLVRNKKKVLERLSNLERWEEELKNNKIKGVYEKLKIQEFEYERRKSRLQKNMALLKCEEKRFHSELAGMGKQKDIMFNENIKIQQQLYAEIEKSEQVLFIIRSLNSMNLLYEKIMEELVASVRGEKTRRIVSSFLKGESPYEIAQKEGKSATAVQRMVLLVIKKLKKPAE